ncbi:MULTISPECIES: hypothetical protein [Vibrio]|uniref:Uncharacterized protein n=1 Tax=Vibrio proteolyticus NBRC 13287 TaxID=1219065 RepID=U3B6Q2_VIBPR|nr:MULTISPECIES: hypothetical protein [Vibrio]NAW57140.1 hypothetical protein [Vibrio sp. V36_P2S2PM302]NAX24565.1 hypothetical protein [Vibrio sp. V38_P2S17PM301]NAX31034.1 hypothetical protein [Vibrio sp. V37_P2S8PM304]GAD65529.1 hypothetical protein VPR01S_01_03020 [Vibrio proteolyticus NBRC 13287]
MNLVIAMLPIARTTWTFLLVACALLFSGVIINEHIQSGTFAEDERICLADIHQLLETTDYGIKLSASDISASSHHCCGSSLSKLPNHVSTLQVTFPNYSLALIPRDQNVKAIVRAQTLFRPPIV